MKVNSDQAQKIGLVTLLLLTTNRENTRADFFVWVIKTKCKYNGLAWLMLIIKLVRPAFTCVVENGLIDDSR